MAKKVKKLGKEKKTVEKRSIKINFVKDEFNLGIVCVLFTLGIAYYFLQGLYDVNTQYRGIRIFLTLGILASVAHSAFWYCNKSNNFKYSKYVPIAVIFVIGIFYAYTNTGNWYLGGDSGLYLNLAKSLATFQGYQSVWNPIIKPHTLYGFGLPIILVPSYWIFGVNLTAFNLSVMITGLIALFLFYKLYKNDIENNILILLIMGFGLNYWLVQHSTVIMTELPYFMFLFLAAFFIKKYEKDSSIYSLNYFLFVIFGFLAYQTKPYGLAIAPAAFFYLMLRKKYNKSGMITLGYSILFIGWNVRNYIQGNLGYFSEFFLKTNASTDLGIGEHFDGMGLIGNLLWKPFVYLADAWQFLTPMIFSQTIRAVDMARNHETQYFIIYSLILVVIVIGLVRRLIVKRDVLDFAFVITFYAVSLYGGAITPERWWIPLIPFSILYFIEGWKFLFHLMSKVGDNVFLEKIEKSSLVIFLSVIIFIGVQRSTHLITNRTEMTPTAAAFINASEWAGENIPEDAILGSRLDKESSLIANRMGENIRTWQLNKGTFSNTPEQNLFIEKEILRLLIDIGFDYWILDYTRPDTRYTLMTLQKNQPFFSTLR